MLRSINTILKRKNNRNNFSELYNNLERVEFDFVLDPRNFSKFAVSELFNNFLQQNFQGLNSWMDYKISSSNW